MKRFFALPAIVLLLSFAPWPKERKCNLDGYGKTLTQLNLKGKVKFCHSVSLGNYHGSRTSCDTYSISAYRFDINGRMLYYVRKKQLENTQQHCLLDSFMESYLYDDLNCSVRRVLWSGKETKTLFRYETQDDSTVEYVYDGAADVPREKYTTVYGGKGRIKEEYGYHGSLLHTHTTYGPGIKESRTWHYTGNAAKGWSYRKCDTTNSVLTDIAIDSNFTEPGISRQKTITHLDSKGRITKETKLGPDDREISANTYTYDDHGMENCDSHYDNGKWSWTATTTCKYDSKGRLTESEHLSKYPPERRLKGDRQKDLFLAYDAEGNYRESLRIFYHKDGKADTIWTFRDIEYYL